MTISNNIDLDIEEVKKFLKDKQLKFGTTQNRLSFPIIRRIYIRCKLYYLGDVKVCKVKNIVVEGNHRYIAYSIAGIDFDDIPYTSNTHDAHKAYRNVVLDENDWDANCEQNHKYCDDNYVGKDWIKRL